MTEDERALDLLVADLRDENAKLLAKVKYQDDVITQRNAMLSRSYLTSPDTDTLAAQHAKLAQHCAMLEVKMAAVEAAERESCALVCEANANRWRKEAARHLPRFRSDHAERDLARAAVCLDDAKAIRLRQSATLAAPEQLEPVAWPTLTQDERAALERFDETCQDGQQYDVPKAMMMRLSEIGVVHHLGGQVYCFTEVGRATIDTQPKAPGKTI